MKDDMKYKEMECIFCACIFLCYHHPFKHLVCPNCSIDKNYRLIHGDKMK